MAQTATRLVVLGRGKLISETSVEDFTGHARSGGVSSTAREALAETRRLLGILRADSGQEVRRPLPGLSDLDGRFTRVRAAGLPVRYERSGLPADTPAGVQLVIFRLVQEGLTNTMKHAGPAPAPPSGFSSNPSPTSPRASPTARSRRACSCPRAR